MGKNEKAGSVKKRSLMALGAGCLAMLAAVFSGCTAAPAATTYTPELTGFLSGWQALGAVAVVISVFFVGAGYIIGNFLQDEPLKAKVKSEFFQVIYSGLIILFAAVLIAGIDGLVTSVAQMDPQSAIICNVANAGPCHIALSRNFLDIIFKTAQAANLRILMINSVVSTISSAGVEFRMLVDPVPILNTSPFAGTSITSETLAILFDVLVKLMMFLRFQELFLDLVYRSLFPVLFFTGLILRTFFFTRKLGGLLIAVALGAYVVLPMMYALSGYILFASTGSTYNALLFNVSFNLSNVPSFGEASGQEIYTYDQNQVNQGQISIGACFNENDTYLFSSNNTSMGLVPPITIDDVSNAVKAVPANKVTLYDQQGNVDPLVIVNVTATVPGTLINATSDQNINYTIRQFGSPATVLKVYGHPLQSASGTLSTLKSIWQSFTWFFNYDFGTTFFTTFSGDALLGFGGLIDNVAMIMLFAMFMPFVSLMVTIASVKVMSPLLGGDVEIAGLTRLI